ncbi:MAG TPA: PhnD/SsuA/transferrin family substrate-binding protein [Candidatus Limnocylindria bacterium]|nr:PhnD/SsuA/transferrin family substrate-binding protein [Candidatus Limnocylindria bacterium]
MLEGAIRTSGGAAVDVVTLPLAEVVDRTASGAYDAGEFSFLHALTNIARDDDTFVFLPVFPHRVLRHSMLWTRSDSELRELAQLRGARIGIGAYATTGLLYLRGLLEDEHGIRPDEITWVRTRPERTAVAVSGVVIEDVSGETDDLLARGVVDAVAVFTAPRLARSAPPLARPLVRDVASREAEYLERTGILPIMHVVALKSAVHRDAPDVAPSLIRAFERARSGTGVPAYGIEANRPALDAAIRYAGRQLGLVLPGDVSTIFTRA